MRVVSLLAAGTEIVCDLGAGDMLVGRSHECDNPAWVRSLPQCSDVAFDVSVSSREIDAEVKRRLRSGEPLYRIDNDLIRELAPDLVIAQTHCEVCAVTPAAFEGGYQAPRLLALAAGSLAGIFEDIMQIARALGLEEKGEALVRCEQRRLNEVRERTEGRPRPTVAMLEWTDPVFTMANWIPELAKYANGALLPADADPEYVIVAPCGFGLKRALQERAVLEAYPWWNELRAVRAGKVAFADGNLFFNRSGMTVAKTAEIMAEILHGVAFGAPTQNVHWRWMESFC